MLELTMERLEKLFGFAKKYDENFIALKIYMPEFDECEVIINSKVNFDKKLEYIKKTYDENLNHKYSEGVRIVDFTFGLDWQDLYEDLNQWAN